MPKGQSRKPELINIHPSEPYSNSEFKGLNSFRTRDDEFLMMVLSSDEDALAKFVNDTNLSKAERKFFEIRLSSIRHVKELEKKRLNQSKHDYKIVDKFEKNSKGKNIRLLLKRDQTELQTTSQGCWSVSMMLLLRAMGVEIKQEEIRAFRPDYNAGDMKDILKNRKDLEGGFWVQYSSDSAANASDISDLVLKTVPNTGFRYIQFSGEYARNSKAAMIDEITEKIRYAILERHVPVSILFSGHYRTVTGIDIEAGKIYVEDSQHDPNAPDEKNQGWVDINTYLKTAHATEIYWLEPLTVKENGEVTGIPEDFAGMGYEKGKLVPGKYYDDTSMLPQVKGKAYSKMGREVPGRIEKMVLPTELVSPYIDKQIGENNPAKGREIKLEYDGKLIAFDFNDIIDNFSETGKSFYNDAMTYFKEKGVDAVLANGTEFEKDFLRMLVSYSQPEVKKQNRTEAGYKKLCNDLAYLTGKAGNVHTEDKKLQKLMGGVAEMSQKADWLWNKGIELELYKKDQENLITLNISDKDKKYYVEEIFGDNGRSKEELAIKWADHLIENYDYAALIEKNLRDKVRPTIKEMEDGIKAIYNANINSVLSALNMKPEDAKKSKNPAVKALLEKAREKDISNFEANKLRVADYVKKLNDQARFTENKWSNEIWNTETKLIQENYGYSSNTLINSFSILKKAYVFQNLDQDLAGNNYEKLMDMYVTYLSKPELMEAYLETVKPKEEDDTDSSISNDYKNMHDMWDVYEVMAGNFESVLAALPENIRNKYKNTKIDALRDYCSSVTEMRGVLFDEVDSLNDRDKKRSNDRKKNQVGRNQAKKDTRFEIINAAHELIKLHENVPDDITNKAIIEPSTKAQLPSLQSLVGIKAALAKYVKGNDYNKPLNKYLEINSFLRNDEAFSKAINKDQLNTFKTRNQSISSALQTYIDFIVLLGKDKCLIREGGEEIIKKVIKVFEMDKAILDKIVPADSKTPADFTFDMQLLKAKEAVITPEVKPGEKPAANSGQQKLLKEEQALYDAYKENECAKKCKVIKEKLYEIEAKYWRNINICAAQVEVIHKNLFGGESLPFDSKSMQKVENLLYEVTKNRPKSLHDFYTATDKIFKAANAFIKKTEGKSLSSDAKKQLKFCKTLSNVCASAKNELYDNAIMVKESKYFKKNIWKAQVHAPANPEDYYTLKKAKTTRAKLKKFIQDDSKEFSLKAYASYTILDKLIKSGRTGEISRLTEQELVIRTEELCKKDYMKSLLNNVNRGLPEDYDVNSVKDLNSACNKLKELCEEQDRKNAEKQAKIGENTQTYNQNGYMYGV